MESIWFRMPVPSNGAPTNSSEVCSLNERVNVGFENRFTPPCPGGPPNSDPARVGEGPPATCRSREELDDAYAAALGEVAVRTWPDERLFDLGYGAEGALWRLPEER